MYTGPGTGTVRPLTDLDSDGIYLRRIPRIDKANREYYLKNGQEPKIAS